MLLLLIVELTAKVKGILFVYFFTSFIRGTNFLKDYSFIESLELVESISFGPIDCLLTTSILETLLSSEPGLEPNANTLRSVLSTGASGTEIVDVTPGFMSPFDFKILLLNFYIN